MRILLLFPFALLGVTHADHAALKSSLTIFASFDRGVDADFAKGDPRLHTWIDRGKKLSKRYHCIRVASRRYESNVNVLFL